MSKDSYLPRLRLIITKLEKGPATYNEINSFLKRESEIYGENYSISLRTLQRDILFINNKLDYEIINERFGNKKYFLKSRPENHNINDRLLESYQIIKMIGSSVDNKHIFLESRIAKGLDNFPTLHYAIKAGKEVSFNYYKFWDQHCTKRCVNPIALKESQGRWYLLAEECKSKELKTFGLDRINEIDVSKSKARFEKKYDINELFKNSFGIIDDKDVKIEKIQFSLPFEQAQYLKAYPLHSSQAIVSEKPTIVCFEMELKISFDLIKELLSFGGDLKVIKPQSLIIALKKRYQKGYKNY